MSLQSQLDKVSGPAWMLYYRSNRTPKYKTYQECFESNMADGIAYHQTGPWFSHVGPWLDTEDIAIKAHEKAKQEFEFDQTPGMISLECVAMNRETMDDVILQTELDENFIDWA